MFWPICITICFPYSYYRFQMQLEYFLCYIVIVLCIFDTSLAKLYSAECAWITWNPFLAYFCCKCFIIGIVREQKIHVYVQQSSRITFPFKPLIESGSEFAQMKISLNSGAGMAGTILNLLCLLWIRVFDGKIYKQKTMIV